MKQLVWCLLASALCLGATPAFAQVREGSFKLGAETNLLTWDSERLSSGGVDIKEKNLAFGPDSALGAGWNAGFVVTPHVIVGTFLSFGRTKAEHAGSSDTKGGLLELRPQVEVPFNPDSRFVLSGLAGFEYTHYKSTGSSVSITTNGYGPTVGLVGHAFVVPMASIDLGARFAYLVYKQKDDPSNTDRSALAILLTAGVSLWP